MPRPAASVPPPSSLGWHVMTRLIWRERGTKRGTKTQGTFVPLAEVGIARSRPPKDGAWTPEEPLLIARSTGSCGQQLRHGGQQTGGALCRPGQPGQDSSRDVSDPHLRKARRPGAVPRGVAHVPAAWLCGRSFGSDRAGDWAGDVGRYAPPVATPFARSFERGTARSYLPGRSRLCR